MGVVDAYGLDADELEMVFLLSFRRVDGACSPPQLYRHLALHRVAVDRRGAVNDSALTRVCAITPTPPQQHSLAD